ncbi:hypothetical protein B0I35DRAFT_506372 [Stachybotrys elegans]|uniref:Uncharacterized protein n=1 Tax=Stachybotrys elegans TaxID=80388 RepID=A0A8K0T0T5_9HYPO|nr:hypothetical protein B0I35DRAFT_506372 [Stachybotrys elegans]
MDPAPASTEPPTSLAGPSRDPTGPSICDGPTDPAQESVPPYRPNFVRTRLPNNPLRESFDATSVTKSKREKKKIRNLANRAWRATSPAAASEEQAFAQASRPQLLRFLLVPVCTSTAHLEINLLVPKGETFARPIVGATQLRLLLCVPTLKRLVLLVLPSATAPPPPQMFSQSNPTIPPCHYCRRVSVLVVPFLVAALPEMRFLALPLLTSQLLCQLVSLAIQVAF